MDKMIIMERDINKKVNNVHTFKSYNLFKYTQNIKHPTAIKKCCNYFNITYVADTTKSIKNTIKVYYNLDLDKYVVVDQIKATELITGQSIIVNKIKKDLSLKEIYVFIEALQQHRKFNKYVVMEINNILKKDILVPKNILNNIIMRIKSWVRSFLLFNLYHMDAQDY